MIDFNLQVQDALNRRVFLRNTTSFLGLSALARITQAKTRRAACGIPTRPRRNGSFICSNPGHRRRWLFDPKPAITDRRGGARLYPEGQRLTTMTSGRKFPVAPTIFKFRRHGQSGMEFSELLPHLSKQANKLAMIRTVHTEAINHDPAITFCQTGHQLAGR